MQYNVDLGSWQFGRDLICGTRICRHASPTGYSKTALAVVRARVLAYLPGDAQIAEYLRIKSNCPEERAVRHYGAPLSQRSGAFTKWQNDWMFRDTSRFATGRIYGRRSQPFDRSNK